MKKKILWTIDLILLALLVILVGALLIRDRKGKGADASVGQESPGAYAAEGAAPDRPSTVSGLTAEPIPKPEPADGADGTPGGTESTQDAADDAQNAAGTGTDPESGTDGLQQDDFAAGSGTEDVESRSEYTILYGGDVCVQNSIQVTYDAKGTPGIVGENLLAELTGADTTVLNHEFCFSERGEPAPDKQYTFRAHPGYVRLLQD
ncbi:MAG: CapA family protein, partial [Lachnospiraceae bacterium]|nr:CapA family protein [Lachnospiraceae bacterium]